jgi:RNA polymerase sigma-70 factor (ECF subfamily)
VARRDKFEGAEPIRPELAGTLDLLYRRHAAWLTRVLASRLRSTPVDVDDIVQESYVRIARYPADEASRHPKSLLMRIAVNLARDQMRRNVVRGGLSQPGEDDLPDLPAPNEEPERLLDLKRAILQLPPLYRDVFVLSRFTGLTYEEIASHFGISVKTVEWRMSKALAMCAAWLRD